MEDNNMTTGLPILNNIQNNSQNEKKITETKWFKWFLGAIVFVVVSIVVFLCVMKGLPWDMEKRGQLGDMFGVIGALFSGLAFAGVIVTMLQQNEDLNLQRKDLALQRQEIAQTNRELELQRNVMQEQNKTIMLQRFENTFFSMFEMQQKTVEGLVAVDELKKEDYTGRDAMFRHRWVIEQVIQEKVTKDCSLNDALYYYGIRIFDCGRIEPYFLQIFSIIKFVDNCNLLSIKEKYEYICILQSTFSQDELNMIFYFVLSQYSDKTFKHLAEKYALFKNLRNDSLLNPNHKSEYNEGAYEFIP